MPMSIGKKMANLKNNSSGGARRSRDEYRAYCPKCKEPVYEMRPFNAQKAMKFICKHCDTKFSVEIEFLYEGEMLVGC